MNSYSPLNSYPASLKGFEKTTNLATIDDTWKEHLRELDDLKQSVQSATYEQKDPLLIYKFESFNLFKTMVTSMKEGNEAGAEIDICAVGSKGAAFFNNYGQYYVWAVKATN